MRGKVVVVTGAASGIGAAICRRFGRQGAWIALLDMDEAGPAPDDKAGFPAFFFRENAEIMLASRERSY